jgi:hypothetical protein
MDRKPIDPSALQAWATDEAAGLVSRVMEATNAQTQAMRVELQTLRSRNEVLSLEIAEARERADAAESALAHASSHFEETLDELRQEHTETIREQALSCMMLPLDELLTVYGVLDRSTTLADALTGLFNGLIREFSRVALFAVRSNRLEGVQQRGFEFENDISRVTVPLTPDSLLGRAVGSKRLESMLLNPVGDSSATGVPFGGSPCCAVALPIAVRGAIVAVIYADDSDRLEFGSTSPQALIKFAELLLMYALLVFVRISSEQHDQQIRQRTSA